MSGAQPLCDSSGSTETAIALTPRLSNSPFRLAVRPSSVVQTGVKSAGWLNSTAHLPLFQSWKSIGAFGGLGVKVGGDVAQPNCHVISLWGLL